MPVTDMEMDYPEVVSGPIDIHASIEDVRKLSEFKGLRPQESLDRLFNEPWFLAFQDLLKEWSAQVYEMMLGFFSKALPETSGTGMSLFLSIFQYIALGLAILLGVVCVYILLRIVARHGKRQQKQKQQACVENVSEISFRGAALHWENAKEYAQLAQYSEAIQQLYYMVLCGFDEKQLVPYEKHRTNGEYLRCLQRLIQRGNNLVIEKHVLTTLKSTFYVVSRQFESVQYGKKTANKAQYENCLQYCQSMMEWVKRSPKVQEHRSI